MSVKIDPEGPRRSKKDPVRLRKLRQTCQAAFAASSFSSWFSVGCSQSFLAFRDTLYVKIIPLLPVGNQLEKLEAAKAA